VENHPDMEGQTDCPGCAQRMERRQFERRSGDSEAVDFCRPCRLIWFDSNESVQLAPNGVIDIFRFIYQSQGEWRQPRPSQLVCPRCHGALEYTHDLSKNGRFTYFRCDQDHGRLTPFTEFLREKQFVRVLTPAEVLKVQAEVKQVRCSGCGAIVDLAHESACSHCGAPIAILDANAVERALRQWATEGEQREEQRARLAAMLSERTPELSRHCLPLRPDPDSPGLGVDLIEGGIAAIGGMLLGMGYRL